METLEFVETMTERLEKSKLNWTVRKEGLVTTSGIIVPEKIAIVREDTNTILGVHSDSYTPYQNSELFDLLDKVSKQSGLPLHNSGLFNGGEKVYVQLKSNDLNLPGDRIEGFITGINSFDGSTALGFGNSSLTISCMNTFWGSYRQIETKIKHSTSIHNRIDMVLRQLDILIDNEVHNFKYIKKFGDVGVTDMVRDLVIRKLFDLEKEERLDSPDISTNKKNKMGRFYVDLSKEIATKGDTLWGLFSGVTRYTTHSMKKSDNTVSKIFGIAGTKDRETWKMFTELVS